MNERILELADKAIEDMPGAWNIPDEFCKKFAELIEQAAEKKYFSEGYRAGLGAGFLSGVQECVDICQKVGKSGDGYTCSDEISKLYGVE